MAHGGGIEQTRASVALGMARHLASNGLYHRMAAWRKRRGGSMAASSQRNKTIA